MRGKPLSECIYVLNITPKRSQVAFFVLYIEFLFGMACSEELV